MTTTPRTDASFGSMNDHPIAVLQRKLAEAKAELVTLRSHAEDQVTELAAQLATAREDSARLDWLEANTNVGIGASGPIRLVALTRSPHHKNVGAWSATTLRAAIDTARKSTP